MPSVRPTSFCRPEFLRRLKSASIHLLLAPYARYLADREIILPEIIPEDFDFSPLALVLSHHDPTTPVDLVEELEVLELFGSTHCTLALEDDHAELVATLRQPDDTPDDLAIKILRTNPSVVWREFNRKAVEQERTFVKYAVSPFMPTLEPTDERMLQLSALLAPWFQGDGKSSYCRVRYQNNAHGFTLLVTHGDPLNRMGIIDDQRSHAQSQLLRPEKLDLLHFHQAEREWLISGRGHRIKEEYRQKLGLVFHSSATAIQPCQFFTLAPLLEGRGWMEPNGLVTHVRLVSVCMEAGCGQRTTITKGDVVASMQRLHEAENTLISATFALKLTGRSSQVKFTLTPGDNTIAGNVTIPAVKTWLSDTGFALQADEGGILETA